MRALLAALVLVVGFDTLLIIGPNLRGHPEWLSRLNTFLACWTLLYPLLWGWLVWRRHEGHGRWYERYLEPRPGEAVVSPHRFFWVAMLQTFPALNGIVAAVRLGSPWLTWSILATIAAVAILVLNYWHELSGHSGWRDAGR